MQPHHGDYVSVISTVNNTRRMGTGAWDYQSGSGACHASSNLSLFSISLPVLPHEKLMVNDCHQGHGSMDNAAADLEKIHQDAVDSLEDIAKQTIGFLLPDDDDDFLADINDFDFRNMPSRSEESEDTDLFNSLGGMELETDAQESLSMGMARLNLTDSAVGNAALHYGQTNGVGTVAGEHPYGEHPSRTLFVRNINSNVEDSEVRNLFEQYGDIRTLYTACKHRGFVMISYYDIRDARAAMRALQNKPLRRRKLDIHFSIPKDNPSEKDLNQGTLVVFNLDPSVSNEDILKIFGAYGEVKEIRETPHKRHHKFIEFYDVRAAEAALRTLNRSDIAGKRIKLEPSRPGGTRRNFMQQLNPEPELDESRTLCQHVGSPIANSPPGTWVSHSPMHGLSRSPGYSRLSSKTSNLAGLVSMPQSPAINSKKPIGKDTTRVSLVEHESNFQQPHSFPELKLGPYLSSMSFGASTPNASDIETLSGPQFLWGSPVTYPKKPKTGWENSSGGHSLTSNSNGYGHGPYAICQPSSFVGSPQHHHVGSAPPIIYQERQFGLFPESSRDTSILKGGSFGGGINIFQPSNTSYIRNTGPGAAMHGSFVGNMSDNGSPSFRMMSSPRLSPVFLGHVPYPGLPLNGGEIERGRSRRVESTMYQTDIKKQFQLDLEKIANGEDSRTTLMIKNIPNKYTSKMLLAAIDETHKGTYDFLYLPIDFKNKCNVGYAFINMQSPSHIVTFYEEFNGKKWDKFNSEKVASLAYARIQGRSALVAHFQNSSLMNEDKRCRPILFYLDGTETGEIIPEHHPSSNQACPSNGSTSGDSSVSTSRGASEEKLGML